MPRTGPSLGNSLSGFLSALGYLPAYRPPLRR